MFILISYNFAFLSPKRSGVASRFIARSLDHGNLLWVGCQCVELCPPQSSIHQSFLGSERCNSCCEDQTTKRAWREKPNFFNEKLYRWRREHEASHKMKTTTNHNNLCTFPLFELICIEFDATEMRRLNWALAHELNTLWTNCSFSKVALTVMYSTLHLIYLLIIHLNANPFQ